jgi:hypothetical protein
MSSGSSLPLGDTAARRTQAKDAPGEDLSTLLPMQGARAGGAISGAAGMAALLPSSPHSPSRKTPSRSAWTRGYAERLLSRRIPPRPTRDRRAPRAVRPPILLYDRP